MPLSSEAAQETSYSSELGSRVVALTANLPVLAGSCRFRHSWLDSAPRADTSRPSAAVSRSSGQQLSPGFEVAPLNGPDHVAIVMGP